MKVLVLGSGVIGVTSAYFLAQAGHEVTVVDRQRGRRARNELRQRGRDFAGLLRALGRAGPSAEGDQVALHAPPAARASGPCSIRRCGSWGLRLLRNCTAARYELNKQRMLRLAQYSRSCLEQLRMDTGIRYDERMQGTLQLFRTATQVDGAAADMAILARFGVPHELLDRAGCIRAEPALVRVGEKIAGGLRLPGRRNGRLLQVHAESRAHRRVVGSCIPPGHAHPRVRARRDRG